MPTSTGPIRCPRRWAPDEEHRCPAWEASGPHRDVRQSASAAAGRGDAVGAVSNFRLGYIAVVISALPDLVTEYPLAEPLEGLLVRARHAAGHDTETLDRYAAIRQ